MGTVPGPAAAKPEESREAIRRNECQAEPVRPQPLRGRGPTAWLATRGSTVPDSLHTEAEQSLRFLPFRYQKYVAELLLDDERLLFFRERSDFHPGGTGLWGSLAGPRVPAGLLVITDRSVLMMEDVARFNVDLGPWGYRVQAAAIERITDARVSPADAEITLTIDLAGAPQPLEWSFPAEALIDLQTSARLLRAFGPDRHPHALRRAYQEKERQGPVAALARREGIQVGVLDKLDIAHFGATGETPDVIQATAFSNSLSVTNKAISWVLGDEQGTARGPDILWTDLKLTMLSTCALRLRLACPGDRELTFKFEYPQSGPFIDVFTRLRHQMGRP